MAQLDIERLEMNFKQQYEKLLDLLARAIYANSNLSVSDISDGERLESAYALAFKFFSHALTVLYLGYGTNQKLPSLKWDSVDFASIDVITRAALEAFLTFHHVFYASTEPDEKDYRYWAYRAEGLDKRQNIIESIGSEEERKELEGEKKKVSDKLRSNRIFQNLKDGQKKRIFQGNGMWRRKPDSKDQLFWRDIGIEAGFSKFLANYVYHFLCASAHSSSIGVRQTFPTLNKIEEKHIYGGTVVIMNIVIANLIQEFCGLFPRSQDILNKNAEESNLAKQWIQRGRTLDKLMGIDNDKV